MPGDHVLRAGDGGDPAAAGGDQVAHRRGDAAEVVDVDVRHGRLAPIGRPLQTTGMPSRASVPGSGSAPCIEANMTPST